MKREENNFTNSLINWYSIVKRDLPWRTTKNPYNVWLSEIILQQTRIDQGLPYYLNFVEHYPDVMHLAAAKEQEVLKLWEGLGYYTRARNLHSTAIHITKELAGKFPDNYADLLRLKGIGPYTAAAIASICFDEAVPVIDGNVFRFASRYFGIEKDISEPKNRKYFEAVLQEVIPSDEPGAFNQAMMEFGATVCKPSPGCGGCPFTQSCFAYRAGKQRVLPVKLGKTKVRELYIAYLLFDTGRETLMRMRTSSIWTGLYEFHNIESPVPVTAEDVQAMISPYKGLKLQTVSEEVQHLLSHRKLQVTFYQIEVSDERIDEIAKDLRLTRYSWQEVLTLPRPKVIVNHLQGAVF